MDFLFFFLLANDARTILERSTIERSAYVNFWYRASRGYSHFGGALY